MVKIMSIDEISRNSVHKITFEEFIMAYQRKNPIPDHHQEILNAIGMKILELRKTTNLSLERFCAKNNIPRISYSNLESGKNFHMSTLLKVLGAYPEVKSLENFFKGL
jgi:predicted transcriptional regulator